MHCNTLILVVTSVYCGQTAGCIRTPLGTEVGLSLGDIVLDGAHLPLGMVIEDLEHVLAPLKRLGSDA